MRSSRLSRHGPHRTRLGIERQWQCRQLQRVGYRRKSAEVLQNETVLGKERVVSRQPVGFAAAFATGIDTRRRIRAESVQSDAVAMRPAPLRDRAGQIGVVAVAVGPPVRGPSGPADEEVEFGVDRVLESGAATSSSAVISRQAR